MNETAATLLTRYLTQQQQLHMPDFIMSTATDIDTLLNPARAEDKTARTASAAAAPATKEATPGGPTAPIASAPDNSADSSSGPRTPAASKRTQLKRLYYQSRECDKCALCNGRHKSVFGAGNVDAPLMVVGEAPGAQEDREGLPFVGKAGELLTKMLQSISLDRRQDTFITNVCKCRPPQNRTPEFSEIQMCLPLLVKQVEIIAPKAILTLGKTAAQALLDRSDTIGKLRSESHRFRSIPLVVTYHPAALLRNPSLKQDAYHDLCSCKAILDTATAS